MVIGFMASTALSCAQPAFAETLQETVLKALSAHPSVEVALAGKNVAEQTKQEARSALYPVVSAATSLGGIYADNSTSRGLTVSRGAASSSLWEANASLTQPLYDGMETKNRIDAANARMQSADFNVLDVRENLALRATQAHIGVLQAEATVKRTQSYFEAIEDYLTRIEMMVNEGVADESEAAQAKNISLMLKSTLTDYEGQLKAALASYNEIVGQYPQSALVKPSNAKLVASNIQGAMAYARENHPLLKAREKELEAIGYDIKAEKAGIMPDLDAELSGIQRGQKEEIGGDLTDARAVVRLSWDFETGGAMKARTGRALAQQEEILAQNEEQLRTIEGDVRRAYAELETAQKQMDLVKQRESVTSELFEAYKTQFEGARVRLLQLMQAENQLFNAQLDSITADHRYLLAQYNVLASIGQLQNNLSVEASSPMPTNNVDLTPLSTSTLPSPTVVSQEVVSDLKIENPIQKIEPVLPPAVVPVAPRYIPSRLSASERIYIKTK